MVFEQDLNDLRARKALLQVECRLQRGLLDLDVARLREGFNVVGRGAGWLHQFRPYLPLLAPVAGFILVRKWRAIARWGGRALVWKLLRGSSHRR
jgi:hypothetical protein